VLEVRGRDRRRKSIIWLGRIGNMMYRHRIKWQIGMQPCGWTAKKQGQNKILLSQWDQLSCVECQRPIPAGWPVGVWLSPGLCSCALPWPRTGDEAGSRIWTHQSLQALFHLLRLLCSQCLHASLRLYLCQFYPELLPCVHYQLLCPMDPYDKINDFLGNEY
jgi:hypothetical protein